MFKAFLIKDKRKLYLLSGFLLIIILIPGVFWRILPGADFIWLPIDKIQEKSYNLEITGFEFNNGETFYEYESERAFNGDGYSIWIYEIDQITANYFKNPNDIFFKKHPRSELRSHWKTEFWKRTPFDKKEQQFLDFAHISLDKLDFELTDLLNEHGNYYAYEHYTHHFSDESVYIGNIDFYIICPNRRIIVKINHNT